MVQISDKKASAGRVLILPRGEWNPNVTYNSLDLVNRNGYAYLCKKTNVNIEPSNDHPDYWHNMLDIERIVNNSIADTVADEVGDLLEERFRDMLSEARYVSDLVVDFTEATFVQWDAETENTPYKAELTEKTEGFAFVFGNVSNNHTIIAWTMGGDRPENFTHYINDGIDKGWDVLRLNLKNNVSGILGVENGGTGAESAEKALEKLGAASVESLEALSSFFKEYQKPWNIKGHVGAISPFGYVIGYCSSTSTPTKISFEIYMKNSGEVYLNFVCKNGQYAHLNKVIIYINGVAFKTYTNPSYDKKRVLLNVNKGDIVNIEGKVIAESNSISGSSEITNIYLSANTETPYIYLSNPEDNIKFA